MVVACEPIGKQANHVIYSPHLENPNANPYEAASHRSPLPKKDPTPPSPYVGKKL
jgi:hypothetical protein